MILLFTTVFPTISSWCTTSCREVLTFLAYLAITSYTNLTFHTGIPHTALLKFFKVSQTNRGSRSFWFADSFNGTWGWEFTMLAIPSLKGPSHFGVSTTLNQPTGHPRFWYHCVHPHSLIMTAPCPGDVSGGPSWAKSRQRRWASSKAPEQRKYRVRFHWAHKNPENP